MSAGTHDAAQDVLALDGVRVRIDGRAILDGIDLRFARGTLTALVGPNGAGKSTLLAVASGDLAPAEGRVRLSGAELRDWKARPLARERSVLPQDHAVRFGFSVREVVAMGRLPHPPAPAEDGRIVDAALASADVTHLAARDVQTLSGGEASRTAFARVLAQTTPVVFLDEPTAALDLQHQEAVLRIARGLERLERAGLVEKLVAPQRAATADLAAFAQQGPAAQQIGLQGQLHEARGFVTVGTLLQEQAHGGGQQRLKPDSAGGGLLEGETLGLLVLRRVEGGDRIDQPRGHGLHHRAAILLRAKRRRHLEEGAVVADIEVVQRKVMDRHTGGNVQPRLRPFEHRQRAGGGDLIGVVAHAGHLDERHVPLQPHAFGDGRDTGQAAKRGELA